MKRNELPYYVVPRGRLFRVYKREDKGNGGTPATRGLTYEQAQAEAYRLNGEYLKEQKQGLK
jgi:hypothetical protein